MRYCHHGSPLGPLLLAGERDALALIGLPGGKRPLLLLALEAGLA